MLRYYESESKRYACSRQMRRRVVDYEVEGLCLRGRTQRIHQKAWSGSLSQESRKIMSTWPLQLPMHPLDWLGFMRQWHESREARFGSQSSLLHLRTQQVSAECESAVLLAGSDCTTASLGMLSMVHTQQSTSKYAATAVGAAISCKALFRSPSLGLGVKLAKRTEGFV